MALKQIIKRSSNIFEGAGSSIKNLFKTNDSKIIKTTSKTLGSKATVISGGKEIAKTTARNFSTGVSGTARVGGKVIAGTGIVAVPVAAGIYGYDKFKNTLARQEDFYRDRDSNQNYEQETENLKDRIKVLDKAKDMGIDTPDYFLEGGSSTPSSGSQTGNGSSGISPYAWLGAGLVAVAIGAYAYSKKGAKK